MNYIDVIVQTEISAGDAVRLNGMYNCQTFFCY